MHRRKFDVDDALMKAMSLFWKQGYAATSVVQLESCIGIGSGRLHAVFGSKRRLFVRALGHYDEVWRERWVAEIVASSTPRGAVLDVFEAAVAVAVEDRSLDGCLLINTALELSPHDREVTAIVNRAFAEMGGFFRARIERGKAVGEISQDVNAKATAAALLTMFIGLRVVARSCPEEPLLRAIVGQAEALLPAAETPE